MSKLLTCPDCGNAVSKSAPSCPKCGRVLKKVPKQYGCCGLLAIGTVATLGLLLLASLFSGPPKGHPATSTSPPPARTQPSQPTIAEGDEAVLNLPGAKHLFLAANGDDEAWDRMIAAQNRKDAEEIGILATQGRVLIVANGTRAKVLETRFASTLVRIREGENAGREGWIQKEFVRAE